jgi:polyisoprenoid-binding protein YceI
MRSHVQRMIHFASSGVGLFFLLLILAVCVASAPAHAQDNAWQADAQHSIARLSLGSGSKSVEVGITRVSGTVAFDANDLADPVVNLKLTPEDSARADYSQISFKSKRSEMTADGKIAVVGDLSLTRVERSVTMDASEGYYGAQYGEPVAHTDTQEVTLAFPATDLTAAHSGTLRLSAATTISRERFPQLVAALARRDGQSLVVQDENCTMPSSPVGEDYSGAICTGKVITTATNSVAPATPAVGEGYYGFEPAAIPDGSQATIAFDLQLTPVASGSAVGLNAAQVAGN